MSNMFHEGTPKIKKAPPPQKSGDGAEKNWQRKKRHLHKEWKQRLNQVTKKGRTNRRNAGKISADRSTKTTLMLTIPGCN